MSGNMKVTFFSNYLLHHQTPFCEAMVKRLGEDFHFVATEPTPQFRLNLGYRNYYDEPYAVYSYKSKAEYDKAVKLANDSDVVIIGSAPEEFITQRIKSNKLTFRYSERFFKQGRIRILDPRVFIAHYKQDFRYRNKNLYMLCASAYTAPDCRFIFSYPGKTFKWGYFPEVNQPPFDEIISEKSKNTKIKILWASRFIKLKHPEDVIDVAEKLKNDNLDFEIEMLGIGELRNEYEEIAEKKGLKNIISFTGPFPPEDVLKRMKKTDIFLFTSDRNEGWGAVLNESMSNACAVVASREIGSVPYLIENGKNGLVYDRKDKNSLYNNVKSLIDDKNMLQKIQKNAYDTIKNIWSADVAAERILALVNCIKNGMEIPFSSGPCSKD